VNYYGVYAFLVLMIVSYTFDSRTG
jgi:hypothetical protein